MATRKVKRYEEGGDIDEMEAANKRTDLMLMPNERGDAGTSETVFPSEKPKAKTAPKARDTGDEAARLENRYKKPPLRQVTQRELAESYNAKRFAKKAEDAAKDAMPRNTQSRILTGINKKSDENKFMGSVKMKSGGSVSSASKRADGIAIRGKTRA
jgi:hypothetical protein